jgi:vacuolar-type H+-ATPase subunit E/Vma4
MKTVFLRTVLFIGCLTAASQTAPSAESEAALAQVNEKVVALKSRHAILEQADRPVREAGLREAVRAVGQDTDVKSLSDELRQIVKQGPGENVLEFTTKLDTLNERLMRKQLEKIETRFPELKDYARAKFTYHLELKQLLREHGSHPAARQCLLAEIQAQMEPPKSD